MKEQWILKNVPGDYKTVGETLGIDPLIVKILYNRKLTEPDQIEKYLHGTLNACHSPYLLKDAESAAKYILAAIQSGECISIATDYDTDGVMSSFILKQGIEYLGGKAKIYAPDRVGEGYGLNRRIVDMVAEVGSRFLITCDNGIAAMDGVSYAKSLGITVVVTDHHEVQYEERNGEKQYLYPEADAIVNPKQPDCPYPWKEICGAVVVCKLLQVLFDLAGENPETCQQWLPFVAIATVTDVMLLQDENRIIVKEGLERMKSCGNLGLQALLFQTDLTDKPIDSYHIGFVIGPCFNAAGRLSTMEEALALLESPDAAQAKERAERLKHINDVRKDMTEQGVELALGKLRGRKGKLDKILVLYLEEIHESLAGIIAGRIKERYHRPVLVFTDAEGEAEDGGKQIKGSGRSIEKYNMFQEILGCKELLSRFGGHPMAAGVTMPYENLAEFGKRLNENTTLSEEDFIPVVTIDSKLPLKYISEGLVEDLRLLEPFGNGNAKPQFAGQHYKVSGGRIFGKNRNVLKLQVDDGTKRLDAMLFGVEEICQFQDFIEENFGRGELDRMFQGRAENIDIGLVFYPSINEYMGVKTPQIVIRHYCRIQ